MKREDIWPPYDVQQYAQLLINTITKALADLKKLGITKAEYWALYYAPDLKRDHVTSITIPLDQFPYKNPGVDVHIDNVDKFNLTLRIAEGLVEVQADMTIDELLTLQYRPLLDALSADAVLKLVNMLENHINERNQNIQYSYEKDHARMRWHLAEPDLLRRKQMCKDLHSVFVRKTEAD